MFIGTAAAAAVRMGLHVPSASSTIPLNECMVRKRTYRSLVAMDIYVATFLGQPCNLQGLNGHQDYDTGLDPCDDAEIAWEASMEVLTLLRKATQESYFSGAKPGVGEIYGVSSSVAQNYNRRITSWFGYIGTLTLPA